MKPNIEQGEGDGNLGLTHGLNGIRNTKNIIQDQGGGRKDYKIDCIGKGVQGLGSIMGKLVKPTVTKCCEIPKGWGKK